MKFALNDIINFAASNWMRPGVARERISALHEHARNMKLTLTITDEHGEEHNFTQAFRDETKDGAEQ